MTTVMIDPGVCNFVTKVTAESEDQMEVKLHVSSGCAAVQKMMAALGDTFDAYELCLAKPGAGPLFEFAGENFPVHAGCPVTVSFYWALMLYTMHNKYNIWWKYLILLTFIVLYGKI